MQLKGGGRNMSNEGGKGFKTKKMLWLYLILSWIGLGLIAGGFAVVMVGFLWYGLFTLHVNIDIMLIGIFTVLIGEIVNIISSRLFEKSINK